MKQVYIANKAISHCHFTLNLIFNKIATYFKLKFIKFKTKLSILVFQYKLHNIQLIYGTLKQIALQSKCETHFCSLLGNKLKICFPTIRQDFSTRFVLGKPKLPSFTPAYIMYVYICSCT